MKIIPKDSKILALLHNDFDASCQAIVLDSVYSNIKFMFNSFDKIDNVMENIDYKKYDFVIVGDISPNDHSLMDISDNIILLDHHASAINLNNPKKMHYVISGICAAKLTKRFVENMYNIKLTHLNSLIYICQDYDLYTLKNGKSKLFNDLFFYFYKSPIKFLQEFKSGRTRFTKEEIIWLRKRRIEFNDRWQNLNVYDFNTIKGCAVEANYFLNEIADKLIKEEGYNLVIIRNPNNNRVSLRHNIVGPDEDFWNAGDYLKSLNYGGGHPRAAGIIITDDVDFRTKMEVIEKYVYDNFITVRR